jgi:hypothetical protein
VTITTVSRLSSYRLSPPSDEGEKAILGATLMLAVYILLSQVNMLIPQFDAPQVPHIVVAIEAGFFLTAISLAESVLVHTLRIVTADLPVSFNRAVADFLSDVVQIGPP